MKNYKNKVMKIRFAWCHQGLFMWMILSYIGIQTGAGAQNTPLPTWYNENGKIISGAMSGGFLAPQFSMFDLNGDGQKELISYDRFSGMIGVWQHLEGIQYVWAADEIDIVWPRIKNWMLIRDFNHDGIPDIFTQGLHGIAVYEGYRVGEGIRFRPLNGDSFIDDSLAYTTRAHRKTNIFHGPDDIPVIADVDGDGDLDIMTFDPQGTFLHYYENQSEKSGKEFDFVHKHQCWGTFVESLLNNEIVLSDDPTVCPPAFSKRHSGGASAIIDLNDDGIPDLLVGDRDFPYVKGLFNAGTADSGFVTRVDTFPFYGEKALLHHFPAPYVLDVDQDGYLDVVAAHNDYPKNDLEGVLVFRNTGSPGDFEITSKHWLEDELIDLGQYSAPLFVHISGQESPDLLVAYNKTIDDRGPFNYLAYFQWKDDGYQLIDPDFLPEVRERLTGGYQPGLAAGDIDGDGDVDILITLSDGSCHLLENGSDDPFTFELKRVHHHWQGLILPSGASPELYDIDGDGALDLIAGNDQGTIHLFRNNGTPQNPQFVHHLTYPGNVRRLGDIRTNEAGEIIGRSSPRIMKWDDELILVTGSRSGRIYFYRVDMERPEDPWEELDFDVENFSGRYNRLALKQTSTEEFYYLSGNIAGGLSDGIGTRIKTGTGQEIEDHSLQVFPNPVLAGRSISITHGDAPSRGYLMISQSHGREMVNREVNLPARIETTGWKPGIYFIKFVSNQGSVTRPLVVH